MSNTGVWDAIMRHARAHSQRGRESHVKVGVLSGGGKSADGLSMVELAAIHEFGAPRAGIPERSFIRAAMRANESEYRAVAARLSGAYVTGKISYQRALELLGVWGATAIKKYITAGSNIAPPLQAATVQRKGSTRPLVDTGQLVNAISHKVWAGRARDGRGRFAGGR
jgi:hypothetical protein